MDSNSYLLLPTSNIDYFFQETYPTEKYLFNHTSNIIVLHIQACHLILYLFLKTLLQQRLVLVLAFTILMRHETWLQTIRNGVHS